MMKTSKFNGASKICLVIADQHITNFKEVRVRKTNPFPYEDLRTMMVYFRKLKSRKELSTAMIAQGFFVARTFMLNSKKLKVTTCLNYAYKIEKTFKLPKSKTLNKNVK